ncbi:MAG: hypothetical protein QOI01_3495, partial [Mycobacterium sp.]|nr:hypothetical protein [Mycobacterium sp.]
PDGTARLARSALHAFASDVTHHRQGRCEAALTSVPNAGRSRRPDSGAL